MTLMGAVPLIGGFTLTSTGEIPHLSTVWRGYRIDAPVKLQYTAREDPSALKPAMRDIDGRLIYALPLGDQISGRR